MNPKNSLLILLTAVSFASFVQTEPLCSTEQSCKDLNNKDCKCYCSVKCGPREKKPDDAPIWFDKANDPYGKGCYCAPRDLRLYVPNKCAIKENE